MRSKVRKYFGKTGVQGSMSMILIRKCVCLVFFPALLIGTCYTASAQAQVYVNIRPTYGPMARPAPPSRAHVWIGEDWVWQGGRYVPAGGRWVLPPHPGYVWVPGRWMHYRRGWQWIPGRWRRGRRY